MPEPKNVNHLYHDDAGGQVTAAYGSNYRRLLKIRATYDPGHVFHINQNIRPLERPSAPPRSGQRPPARGGPQDLRLCVAGKRAEHLAAGWPIAGIRPR